MSAQLAPVIVVGYGDVRAVTVGVVGVVWVGGRPFGSW